MEHYYQQQVRLLERELAGSRRAPRIWDGSSARYEALVEVPVNPFLLPFLAALLLTLMVAAALWLAAGR